MSKFIIKQELNGAPVIYKLKDLADETTGGLFYKEVYFMTSKGQRTWYQSCRENIASQKSGESPVCR